MRLAASKQTKTEWNQFKQLWMPKQTVVKNVTGEYRRCQWSF